MILQLSFYHLLLSTTRRNAKVVIKFKIAPSSFGKTKIELVFVPSIFEVGSFSWPIPLTKNQMRNKNRKLNKYYKKSFREKDNSSQIAINGWPYETTFHLNGSRFNALSTSKWEYEIRCLLASTINPLNNMTSYRVKRKITYVDLKLIHRWMIKKYKWLECEVVSCLRALILKGVKSWMEWDKMVKVWVQVEKRERRRFYIQLATFSGQAS